MSTTCSVDGCLGNTYGKSLCGKHYSRMRRNGDVNTVRTVGAPAASLLDRFVGAYSVSDTGCWNWDRFVNHLGYGKIRVKHGSGWKTDSAHRASWVAHNGEIPDGLHVLHKCDNRRCVNPEHLFLGTHQDNMTDCQTKGRKARLLGQDNKASKLLNADVAEIKKLLALGAMQRVIAEQFGVSANMISHIKLGKKWSHIGELNA